MRSETYRTRPTTVLDLPLPIGARILRPEQVVLNIGDNSHDLGAYCYTSRSPKNRKPGAAREVVLESFLPARVGQIRKLIKVFSSLITDSGLRPVTVKNYALTFKQFMDWADALGHFNCLSGGDATINAYRAFVSDVEFKYRKHEFEAATAGHLQKQTCFILEMVTGLSNLDQGLRLVQDTDWKQASTEPAGEGDFADVIALNEAIFSGVCDLVLEHKPYPYQLFVPKSLGWEENWLWVFPANLWCLPPHLQNGDREPSAYDFEAGRIASLDEIWHLYAGKYNARRRSAAKGAIASATALLVEANSDPQHRARYRLAFHAHTAFFYLFLANTGANLAVARELETDGTIDPATPNQGYRAIKFRAQGKEVTVMVPVAFMPSLRRFLELRRYLLGTYDCPYLFFTMGNSHSGQPEKTKPSILRSHFTNILLHFHPRLSIIQSRQVRATVSDFYQRNHDVAVSARLMGHTEEVAKRNYQAGSSVDHVEDMTTFLSKVSERAKVLVVKEAALAPEARLLADGGACESYGRPEALSANVPIQPDCRSGCLFCANRVLSASETDARKVASAAYLMEQLIRGPESEAEFRPQIEKCDEDLEQIAAFNGCREMVDKVKQDIYENGNLTEYFADKYHLFLELGVL